MRRWRESRHARYNCSRTWARPAVVRLFFYGGLVVALATAAVYFAERPGQVTMHWQGFALTTSIGVLIAVLAVFTFCALMVYRFWSALRRGPRQWARERAARKQEEGYRTLTQGLVAVAAGDPKEARQLGKKAGKLTKDPVHLLLLAQASQLEGDGDAAAAYFTQMLEKPETEFLGLRGLLVEATRNGDWEKALVYARRAYKLRPKTAWVNTTLFDLESRAGNWGSAQETMENAVRHKIVAADEAPRQRAVVMTERAQAARRAGDTKEALALAREAHRLAPDLVPATSLAADLLIAVGRSRAAVSLVTDAWKHHPHPELARIFSALSPDETPVNRVQRLQQMIKRDPDHEESHFAVAEAAIAAKFWDTATSHLERLSQTHPSQRYCRLMARLEEAKNADADAAHRWMLQAQSAPPDPSWNCVSCDTATLNWAARCHACGAFDTLVWRPATAHLPGAAAVTALTVRVAKETPADTPGSLVDAAEARQ